jgi:diacylglycerol kinase (CTP)
LTNPGAKESLSSELKRKSFHLTALVIPLGILILPHRVSIHALAVSTVVILFMELLRLRNPSYARIFNRIFGIIMRKHEKRSFTGSTYLLLACLLSDLLYQKEIAAGAILFLVLGDVSAALVGKHWRKVSIGKKSLTGSLACLASCLLAVWAVPHLPFRIGIWGALLATLTELSPLPIDDNFTIPILSGGIMQIIS